VKREDEQLIARLQKEAEREGLEFDDTRDPGVFHKVVKRLIETPPAPKQQRRKGRARARGTQSKRR
jgi:hypothetical protein